MLHFGLYVFREELNPVYQMAVNNGYTLYCQKVERNDIDTKSVTNTKSVVNHKKKPRTSFANHNVS